MIHINLLRNSQNLPVRYQPALPLQQARNTKPDQAIQPLPPSFVVRHSQNPFLAISKAVGLGLYQGVTTAPVTSSLFFTFVGGSLVGLWGAATAFVLSFFLIYVPKFRYVSIQVDQEKREKEIKKLCEQAGTLKERIAESLTSIDPARPPDRRLGADIVELRKTFPRLKHWLNRTKRMRENLVFQTHLKAGVPEPHDEVLERHFRHVSLKVEQLERFLEDLSRRESMPGIFRLRSKNSAGPKKLPPPKG